MIFALLGVVCGVLLGYITKSGFDIGPQYSIYIFLVILALVNSIFTILYKKNMDEFKIKYCFIYVFVDIIVAILVGFISEKLGLPLYLAIIFAFGNNIYKNLSLMINSLTNKLAK